MTSKRKTLFIGSTALLLCLGLVVTATAFRGGFGSHHELMREFLLFKLDKEVAKLDLNEAQKSKYAELKAKLEAQMQDRSSSREEMRAQITAELDKPTPDLHALAELVRPKLREIPQRIENHITLLLEFYDTLNAEQKAKLTQILKDKLEDCDHG